MTNSRMFTRRQRERLLAQLDRLEALLGLLAALLAAYRWRWRVSYSFSADSRGAFQSIIAQE